MKTKVEGTRINRHDKKKTLKGHTKWNRSKIFKQKFKRKTKMIQGNVKIYRKQTKNNQHGNNRSPWISDKARETEQTLKL